MILKIIKFEIIARYKQPMSLLLILLMIFQTIWLNQGSYQYYLNDATFMNGAALFYRNFAGGGNIMVMIIAIITGTVLYKDIQYKAAGIMYSLPISDKTFFIGRFLSAYLINITLCSALFIGMVLVPYSGIGSPDKFGPTPWGQMFHGFFVLTIPNLFILTAACFIPLVFFKRMAASYLGIFLVIVIFMICETLRPNSPNTYLLQLLDPVAFVYTTLALDNIPASAKNYAYLELTPTFFLNRTIWIGAMMALLYLAYRKFSFKHFISANQRKSKKPVLKIDNAKAPLALDIPKVTIDSSPSAFISKFFRLSIVEFQNVVRPTNFKVILLILCLMFFLQNTLWNTTYYIGSHQPLTSTMTTTRVTLGVFLMCLLMIWTGELLFKDRTLNTWQICDALPIPTWVPLMSKYVAMCGVALILAVAVILCGILSQVILGAPHEIDLSLYAEDLLTYKWGWLTYVLNISIVFFIAGITGSRFLTHVLSIGYYVFNLISIELNIIDQLRFTYSIVPGVEDYSEMNGYGIWDTSILWFFLLWASLAIVLVLLGIHFWKRGTSLNFLPKITFQTHQVNWYGRAVMIAALAAFFVLQSFIVRQVNDKGNYEPETLSNSRDASYELKYKKIEQRPQPRLTAVDLKLDFYPKERKAEYEASLTLTHFDNRPVDTVYINTPKFSTIEELSWNGKKVSPAWKDDELRCMAIALPMTTQEKGTLHIKGRRHQTGFTQKGDNPQPELTYNGSFLSAQDLIPTIGYNSDRELLKNRDRSDVGLEKITSRMSPITDKAALAQDLFAPYSHWLQGKITISTDKSQWATAPGKLVKSWKENQRHHFEYVMEAKAPFEWYFGSARYKNTPYEHERLKINILHKPDHTYNIALYENALASTYRFIGEQLGGYPYSEVRLSEIPFYQNKYYTFPNSIAISEKEGWIADTTALADKSYLFFSIASQMTGHWVLQNIHIGNVQGSHMLKTALPEALALQLVKQKYGEEGVKEILDKKQKIYTRDRGNEPNTEPSLLHADGIDYLEPNKGTLAMYELSRKIGFETFSATLREWSKNQNGKQAHFKSLYEALLHKVADKDLKETKTQFEQ